MLLETRMLPKGCIARPPKRTILFGAAEAFLADGCAALAGQAVQAVYRLGTMTRGDSMRARAMSICACLARLSDRIKTEGAQHSSTGHNQVDRKSAPSINGHLLFMLAVPMTFVHGLGKSKHLVDV